MSIELSGKWLCKRKINGQEIENEIMIPGTVNGSGLGEKITLETEFNSGLHNPFWFEREEYKSGACEEVHVPFLAQPQTFYSGVAEYKRSFNANEKGNYYLFIELTKWRVRAYIDDTRVGDFESLCTPFWFGPFEIEEGEHTVCVQVDNSMIYPYRPDAHTVSDALGENWNGLGGRVELLTEDEFITAEENKKTYAKDHPVNIEVKDGNIVINGKAEYLRGTHFGGDFPLTGVPTTDSGYWNEFMDTVKEWGFNFIRCHSFCPPDAAFLAADEKGMFIQVECGMWNIFNPGNGMYEILKDETRRILAAFGHHPSFVLFSSGNEPGGEWYGQLREWVDFAKKEDKKLGYEGRRIYTAQSGWYYDASPAEISGTDYIYFHRSAYGPYSGGMIRNHWGWNGKDYSPSLVGCKLPVISHEMGQWCAYPDFDVIDKYTGYAVPGNYMIFKNNAEENGVLKDNKEFVYCSGKHQLRLLKEEFEANYRTREIKGYEYLDLHDYTGQGTAQVGILDPFWKNKGYTSSDEFRHFNAEIVILARIDDYVRINDENIDFKILISNYSGRDIENSILKWQLVEQSGETAEKEDEEKRPEYVYYEGSFEAPRINCGDNTEIGEICTDLSNIRGNRKVSLRASIVCEGDVIAQNEWILSVFDAFEADENVPEDNNDSIVYAKTLEEAKAALENGKKVLFNPYLSDLDAECPSLSIKNVFWNAQMGPTWSRELGIVVDDKHPVFKFFSTEKSGGWEWNDIFTASRGFNFPAKYRSIVRVIDDWNRNFPLSLMFEGKVGSGKIFFISADLSGDFRKRPAAYMLKKAVWKYILSDDFNPEDEIDIKDIEEHIMPLYKGSDIIKEVSVNGNVSEKMINIYDINPNIPYECELSKLPASLFIKLKKKVHVHGVYYLSAQRDRDFLGTIRKYTFVAGDTEIEGEWKNSFKIQRTPQIDEYTDTIELRINSVYSMGNCIAWFEDANGWHKRKTSLPIELCISMLGIDYEDDENTEFRRNNDLFWRLSAKDRHTEIDI